MENDPCICCPYFVDGYCHNCTHEYCEKEMLEKEIIMTEEEDKIAFNQWVKDWGHHFPGMPKDALYYIYRSMDEENKLEFLEEARRNK